MPLRNEKQKDWTKPSLKIMCRMKALEDLPPDMQRTMLESVDLMIQSVRANRRDS